METIVVGHVVGLLGHLQSGDWILQLGCSTGILQVGLCLALA